MVIGWNGAKPTFVPPTSVSAEVVIVTGLNGAKLVIAPPTRVNWLVVMTQGGPCIATAVFTGNWGRTHVGPCMTISVGQYALPLGPMQVRPFQVDIGPQATALRAETSGPGGLVTMTGVAAAAAATQVRPCMVIPDGQYALPRGPMQTCPVHRDMGPHPEGLTLWADAVSGKLAIEANTAATITRKMTAMELRMEPPSSWL
jgi:hypothetical protein